MRVFLRLLAVVFCSSARVPVQNLGTISCFLYQRGLFTFKLRLYLFRISSFMGVPLRLLAPVFRSSTRTPLRNLGSISRFLQQIGLFTLYLRLYLFKICLFMGVPLRLLAPVFYKSTRVHVHNLGQISRFLQQIGLLTFNVWHYFFIICLREAFLHLVDGFIGLYFFYLCASPYDPWHLYVCSSTRTPLRNLGSISRFVWEIDCFTFHYSLLFYNLFIYARLLTAYGIRIFGFTENVYEKFGTFIPYTHFGPATAKSELLNSASSSNIQLLLVVETLVTPVFLHFVDNSTLHGHIYFFFTFNVFICEILEGCLRQLQPRLYSINNNDIYCKKGELKRQHWVQRKEIKARFITQGFLISKTESRRNYRKRKHLNYSKLIMHWMYFIKPMFRIFLIVDYNITK